MTNDTAESIIDTITRVTANISDSIANIKDTLVENLLADSNAVDNALPIVSNTNEEIFGIDYNFARIIIPVLVTLAVFLTGQFISWLKSKKERINELNSIKVTIEHWISLIEPTITKQVDGCHNFVTALQNSTNIHPERFQFSPLLVDKLQQIELRELIETIMVNLKGTEDEKAKMIFNLISQVEFLVKMENHIKENYERFQSYTFELMEDWNRAFKIFNSEMNETSRRIHQVEPNCTFIMNKNQICNTFLQHREIQPLETIFNVLIIPMDNEILKFLNTSANKELATNLAYNIDELKIIKRKWDVHKQGHIQLAIDFGTKISTVYGILKTVATQLKNSKFKCILSFK